MLDIKYITIEEQEIWRNILNGGFGHKITLAERPFLINLANNGH